jgi:YwiC-like protein
MTETSDAVRAALQKTRRRALIVPREHGAWGLLLIPLFTGIVAGFASEHRIWPLLLFTVAALSLFWLRTPVESLIGTGSLTANTEEERRMTLVTSVLLATLATASLTGLLWKGQDLWLLLLGGATACALLVQSALRSLGRKARMMAQLVGAIGLTCTAPAAYYIGTGQLSKRAFILWAANWIFASNQIHFVQLRIQSARASTFSQKFARGKIFFLAQLAFFASLVGASFWRVLPPLVIVAFVPALIRGTLWFFRKPESLDVRSLGWSEMRHGLVFGILLAVAFIYS